MTKTSNGDTSPADLIRRFFRRFDAFSRAVDRGPFSVNDALSVSADMELLMLTLDAPAAEHVRARVQVVWPGFDMFMVQLVNATGLMH